MQFTAATSYFTVFPPWVLHHAFLTIYHSSLPHASFSASCHFRPPHSPNWRKTVFYELKPVEWVIDGHLSKLWAHWCLSLCSLILCLFWPSDLSSLSKLAKTESVWLILVC